MNVFVLINKVLRKISHFNRKKNFGGLIKCNHKDFKILGPVYVLNTNIILGKNVIIYPGVTFSGNGPIKIGDNTKIGNNTVICATSSGGVTIGAHTAIAADCYIIDADHGTKRGELVDKQEMVVKKVEIGNNVWLGTHVVVLKGSIIHDGAVVGAMSLVNSEIKEESINVGIPASFIKDKS